jgi:carboxymethylenebutenolidase
LPADRWRWSPAANAPEGNDAAFSFERFAAGVNNDLADTFGVNLAWSIYALLDPLNSAVWDNRENRMNGVNRRVVLGGIAALAMAAPAAAGAAEEFSVEAEEGSIALARYPAAHAGKRAGVLLLHGSRGIELHVRAYQRYADALNAAGIDAYLVRYLTVADIQALDPKTSTVQSRVVYETRRYAGWTRRISSVVAAAVARPESSGRIGLLGFSLGGYVAAATAAHDGRVAALAVLYGGMPDTMLSDVKHLPPLIELHGEADRNVSLAKGQKLVKLARAVGSEAEQVTYPGKAHGFDFSDTDPMTQDAVGRVVRFFQNRLGA